MTRIGDVRHDRLKRWCLTALVLAVISASYSGRSLAGTATAEVDRTETVVGEPIQLSVTVEGKMDGGIKLPAIEGVEIEDRGTQSQVSTSYQSGSGFTVLRNQVATFVLTPSRKANFKIPAVVVKVDGENVKTLPIEIRVEAGRTNGPGAAMSRLFDIERDVPRKKIFAGEALPVVIRLLSKGQLRDRTIDQPAVDHVTVIAAGKERNKASSRGGENVFVFEAPQVWISNQAGKYVIPPAKATGEMLVRGGGFFDSVRAIRRSAEAEGFELEVSPLPSPIPKDFSGLVGKFELKHALDHNKLKVGETATLEMVLEGTGMIEGWDVIKDLPLSFPGAVKVYAGRPKIENVDSTGPDARVEFRQRKTFELQIVAGRAGTWNLGQHTLRYFDPTTGRYESLALDLGSLEVAPDENGNASATGPAAPATAAPDCPPPGNSSASIGGKPPMNEPGTGVDVSPSTGSTLNLAMRQSSLSSPSSLSWKRWGKRVAYLLWVFLATPFVLGAVFTTCFGLRRTGVGAFFLRRSLARRWRLWSNKAVGSISEDDLATLLSLTERTARQPLLQYSTHASQTLGAIRSQLDKRRFGNEMPDWTSLRALVVQMSDALRRSETAGPARDQGAASVSLLIVVLSAVMGCQFVSNHARVEADHAFRDGDFAKLAHDLTELDHSGELGADDYFNLGIALFRSGEKAGARAAFIKAVQVDPNDEQARTNIFDTVLTLSPADSQFNLDNADAVLERSNFWAWGLSLGAWMSLGLGLTLVFALVASRAVLDLSNRRFRRGNPLIVVSLMMCFVGGALCSQALMVQAGSQFTVGVVREGGAELTPNGATGEPPIAKLNSLLAVIVVKESEGACRLQLKDGRRGWTECDHLIFFGHPAG